MKLTKAKLNKIILETVAEIEASPKIVQKIRLNIFIGKGIACERTQKKDPVNLRLQNLRLTIQCLYQNQLENQPAGLKGSK